MADPTYYLQDLVRDALRAWPDNRTLTIACHGHSVPAGYFAAPHVDTFAAYPHLWHRRLKERFPWAVFNVITTAIGGEHAESGAARFASDVLALRPDLVTIDYGLNNRGLGLERARAAWERMIVAAQEAKAKVILLTPTWDIWDGDPGVQRDDALAAHARLIRDLAVSTDVGLADAYAAFERHVERGGDLSDLLSWPNHPNRRGHELVADELMRWIPFALPDGVSYFDVLKGAVST
jgi:acyl-CoA thioesterase-1